MGSRSGRGRAGFGRKGVGAAWPLAGPANGIHLDPPGDRESGSGGSIREPWTLKTTDTLRPGQRGTRRLVAEFGDRLVCVRYRCDAKGRKRYKTVELIVAESDWAPPPGPDDLVHVRVAFGEEDLRKAVKAAGGRWRPESKTWQLPLRVVEELGLRDRIVPGGGSQI